MSNLTGRPVYPKTPKATKNPANLARIKQMNCIIYNGECAGETEAHHALTGGGGRKNDDKVIPLCFNHHRGDCGIHFEGRKVWQAIYGSEAELLEKMEKYKIMQEIL